MAESIDFFPINTDLTSWKASADTLIDIRDQVFVKEQQVPEQLEVDGLDPKAKHWLCWGKSNHPMATARLVGNKIGRMAVLAPYRNKGVGSSLLRAIINYAIENNIETLTLDAQIHAISFYEDNDFTLSGDEFMDAGILHRPMSMTLDNYVHRLQQPAPANISSEISKRVTLSGSKELAHHAQVIASNCQYSIRIFSHHLDPSLYDNKDFCEAVYKMATRHPNAQVYLLVRNTQWLVSHHHLLTETYHRLISHIQLRQLNPERETLHTEFLVGDEKMVLYNQEPDRYLVHFYHHAPVEARRLIQDFDSLWNSSEPDPQVRRLHI